jgi:uncharacterized secreted protein with C-terminal beta-propeller domain
MSDLRWRTRWVGRASVLGWAYVLGLGACAGKVEDEAVTRRAANLESDTGSSEAALTSGANCERLLAHFQAELLEQVSERAEQARHGGAYYGGTPLLTGAFDAATASPSPAGAPLSEQALASGAAGNGSFSDTTVQVPGVDEADFVKADGDRIYLLHGPSLYVLGAGSAHATEILGTLPIEGEAAELFVRDGKVVVFSRISGALPGADQSNNPYYYYYYPTYTKLTVVDVSAASPQVLRESYVEGSYISSRRHDGAVRAIVQQQSRAQLDYPNVSYVDFLGHPYSQHEIDLQVDLWVSLATDTIADSVIEDYLPSELERVNGALSKQPLRCGDYWLPGPGLTQAGATSLVTLDLDEVDDPLRYTTVLGYADRVYANDSALLLTQTDYRYYTGEQTSLQTNIHRFDLDGVGSQYTASGSFSGYVQSQFSLDELDGVIRVSTTESSRGIAVPLPVEIGAGGGAAQPAATAAPVSRILTLGTRGHDLVELGRSPDFGSSEQIYATRFLGDRGYVVTFRQVDPLFVVDLADPTNPIVAGELQLQGYSNFLYPLPDHHLLAIGQDADANGFVQGLAMQIFDVRDPSAPSLAHKYTFPTEGGSDASYDHRAISFHRDQSLVALPFQNYVTGQSTLEVFHVSNSDGFTRLGGAQPPARELSLQECLLLMGYPDDPYYVQEFSSDPDTYSYIFEQCRYTGQPTLRRGLFRGDDIYAVSTLNVTAFALDQLDGPPLSQVDLPPAYPSYYPYYGGGVSAGTAGAAGSTGMAGSAGSAGSAGVAGTAGAAGAGSLPPEDGSGGAAGAAMTGAGGAPFE